MKIGIVASEAVPFAKTGGLADVAGTLFNVFRKMKNEVYLFLPLYKTAKNIGELHSHGKISVKIGSQKMEGEVFTQAVENGAIIFIDQNYYFGRDSLYGTKEGDYPDNAERFAFFDLAVLKAAILLHLDLDILHLNDWQSGLIPLFVKDSGLKIGTLFTIHNLGYQGNFEQGILDLLNINRKYFTSEGLEFYGNVSYLKSGIVYSDYISTVSPSYAKEIQTTEYGAGMDGILRKRNDRLIGILNGIDYAAWSSETDKMIYTNYSLQDLSGKQLNKTSLAKEIEFDIGNKPLFGMVSRLAGQKGMDILVETLKDFLKEDVKVVILGTGEKILEDALINLEKQYPDKLKALIKFDNTLAHKIYAASDFFIMPSLYEPCGLGQLIALKYGTVPVVRETGGLKDTIDNYNIYTHCGNGFSFEEYSKEALFDAMNHAKDAYEDGKIYKSIQRAGMLCDFSWDRSAKAYIKLFKKIKETI